MHTDNQRAYIASVAVIAIKSRLRFIAFALIAN